MKTKNIKLIIVAVVLVLITAGLYLFDSSEKLVRRTNDFELTEDMEIVKVKKHGIPSFRAAYEAKIKVDHSDPWKTVDLLVEAYPGLQCDILSYENYQATADDLFDGYSLIPTPEYNSNVWIGVYSDVDEHEYVFFIDSESQTDAYLYIYYSR
ncbi:MAG: hypothetical protein J5883_08385 [Clostridiales bacterium]|nr:hypothetical protein [Clostridiales bacterium]